MAKAKRKTKAEELQEAVAEAVGAGRELHLEAVDFSDPNRPKTCLEVDFPILHINSLSAIEGSSGSTRKPIYQSSKWWARRNSSVFRSMLIAAMTPSPTDELDAARLVWNNYYRHHKCPSAAVPPTVCDIFMGGGTTVFEAARLGANVIGNDLNPLSAFIVDTVFGDAPRAEVERLFADIRKGIKPQIIPFYACDCPRGHKGKWTHKPSGKVMGANFDPLSLTPEQRPEYEYEGPEVIYTFWAKHGPCQSTECNHRTPIMTSPVIAVKTLTVKAWTGKECQSCGKKFDIEQKDARMAPAAMLVVADTETPFAVMDDNGNYTCPHCGHEGQDKKAASDGQSSSLGKAKNKKIELTLLVHPDWLKGASDTAPDGSKYGGTVIDDATSTIAWLEERERRLKLVEVRGSLPEVIRLPDSSEEFCTGSDAGTVPAKSKFKCQQDTCGRVQDFLKSIYATRKSAPTSYYCFHCYCPECSKGNQPYSGRFFDAQAGGRGIAAAIKEWNSPHTSHLQQLVPRGNVPEGLETSVRTPLFKYGYHRWRDFFNERQLLVQSAILHQIAIATCYPPNVKRWALCAMQQYLRLNNMFCIWNRQADQLEPFFSKNNYQPPARPIENAVFTEIGRGTWTSCEEAVLASLDWMREPWELAATAHILESAPDLAKSLGSGKSYKVTTGDTLIGNCSLHCGSATALSGVESGSVDLVITDPPFGDIMQYGELSMFFYAWLQPVLHELGVSGCDNPTIPIQLEAVENQQRHGSQTSKFYQRLLTASWQEAFRLLKPGGLLAFTFHHDKDGPWISVLESLFEAGFYLEATYPIRSDETKGEGSTPGTFGAQKVEFDIIHVCRKRLEEPEPISWARLRRQIMRDVRQLQEIIEQHQKEGLGEADLQVIRRGKALEYYSRHYGKVYIEKGREDEFTVKDALVGINQLLDDESDTTSEAPPVLAEPYTRQFLRLFADKDSLERDQMQKYLRGTGVSPSEFLERGWCSEEKKIFTITPPLEWAQQWKGKARKGMSRDFDQTFFLIGACYDESGIKASDTLNSGSFVPHPAIADLLDWFGKHGSDADMKSAAKRAKQIYSTWLAKNTKQVSTQRTLFDLEDSE